MITLSLVCPRCRSRLARDVDERFFPPSVGCRCWARIRLRADPEPVRYRFPSQGYPGEAQAEPEKALAHTVPS